MKQQHTLSGFLTAAALVVAQVTRPGGMYRATRSAWREVVRRHTPMSMAIR